jgi:glycogen synthase
MSTVKLAFVTYETPYAPCGGIAAVMKRLPGCVRAASGLPTVVLTPYHHRIKKTTSLNLDPVGSVTIPFDSSEIAVNIYRREGRLSWYFLRPEDERFFAGVRHPFDVGQTQEQIAANLLRDSLLFGAAVARSLPVIDPEAHWTLMMQDWEAATTTLALANQRSAHRLFLTLHNSYDSGAARDDQLLRVGINPSHCPGPPGSREATVLERALLLTEQPVFTVSEQFALDLTEDTFQAEVMAPHLRETLTPRLVGVNNGLFADLAISDDVVVEAARGNLAPLRDWKAAKKDQALRALREIVPSEDQPVWGNLSKFKIDNAPWFVLAGRDDPRQKGYDVSASAIAKFLEQSGDARFLFFPIPGDEGLAGLNFLEKLAQKFPESVLVLPFLFKEGFFAALQGAAYGIMPSLYEPFGMANEFYLNGTVGIGRATGGILQQIVPLRAASSFSRAVRVRAARWHTTSAQPTGILYRERDGLESAVRDWRGINAAAYDKQGGYPDRVEQREHDFALFRSMANELRIGIVDAVRLYQEKPELYYQMLTEGIDYIQRSFSWERAAQEYVRDLG